MMMMTALIMICLRRRWQQIRLRESDEADNEEVKNIMIIVIVTILCKCRGLTIRCKLVHMERMKFLGKAKAWQWNRDFNAEVEHEFLYGSWAFELLRGSHVAECSIYVKGILCKKNYFALIRVWCNFKQCRHVSAQSIFMQDPKRNMRNGTPASLTLRVAPAWSCLAAMNTIIALATIARRCNSKEHTILISMYHCTTLERCSISDRIPSSPT